MRFLIAILVTTFSVQAYAIGDKEEGVLIDILGATVLHKLIKKDNNESYPYPVLDVHGISTPNRFPPFRCRGDSIECAYKRGVWEREYQKWQEAKQKAYECGRYGECE